MKIRINVKGCTFKVIADEIVIETREPEKKFDIKLENDNGVKQERVLIIRDRKTHLKSNYS